MNTRLLLRTRAEVVIKRFLIVDGFLAFELQSGQVFPGETLVVNFLDEEFPTLIFIAQETDGIFISSNPWSTTVPEVIKIKNILIDVGVENLFFATGGGSLGSVGIADSFVQPDNKLIIVGNLTSYNGGPFNGIRRVDINGIEDTSFVVGTGFDTSLGLQPSRVFLMSNGKIIVVGNFTAYQGNSSPRIVRINADGSYDSTFTVAGTGFNNSIARVAEMPDGKIVVSGNFTSYDGNSAVRIARLNTDGSFDSTFVTGTGFTGTVFNGNTLEVFALGTQVIVTGYFNNYNGTPINRICRLNSNGTLDGTFSTSTSSLILSQIKSDENGNLLASATSSVAPFARIIRMSTNGVIDPSLNIGTGMDNLIIDFTVQNGNRIILIGFFEEYNGVPVPRICRIDYQGTLDEGFNQTIGILNNAVATTINQFQDGTIFIGGTFNEFGGFSRTYMVKLIPMWRSLLNEFKEVDLREDLQFPLNYNIADISKPQSRKSNFSKSIKLPGTDNNSKIFTQLFEIDGDHVYNVNLKRSVVVLQDNLEIFNGVIRLDSIDRDDWNTVSYNVSLNGQTSNIFDSLRNASGTDLLLSDLDLSEYSHPFTRDSIIDSWKGDIIKDGLPYANYTFGPFITVSDTEFASGGFTTFVVSDSSSFSVGDTVFFEADDISLFPKSMGHHTVIGVQALRVTVNLEFQPSATNSGTLQVWESKGEGYVYPSIFLGGTGPSGANVDDILFTDFSPYIYVKTYLDKIFEEVGFRYESEFFSSPFFKRLIVDSTSSFIGNTEVELTPFTSPSIFDVEIPIPFDQIITDVSNQWDISTLIYTNTSSDNRVRIDFNMQFANIVAGGGFGTSLGIRFFRSFDPSGAPDPLWASGTGNNLDDIGNPMVFTILNSGLPGLGTTFISGDAITWERVFDIIVLRPGEEIRFLLSYTPGAPGVSIDVTYGLLQIQTESISSIIDMKARDFLISLISMFNLQIEPINSNDKVLIIEPYDDYFQSNFVDWTNKVDISKTIEIVPISNLGAKTYKYNYTEDSDFLNTTFKNNQGEIYGFFNRTLQSEFTDATIETKISFAPTPMFDSQDLGRIVIPAIYRDGFFNRIDKYKMRILYWTGVRPVANLTTTSTYEIDGIDTNNEFQVSMLGQSGHFDNPINATLDLNFGIQPEYFYGDSYLTKVNENTLYYKYHRNLINEISSVDSRLVKMYLKLNSYDIATLDFRRGYWIQGVVYKLQKINDYNPLKGEPVLCEFIKSKPVKPISRPNRLECDTVENGLQIDWVSVTGAQLNIVNTGDTVSVIINDIGTPTDFDGSTLNIPQFGTGPLCLYGSDAEGLPYPESSFGGEFRELAFIFGSINGFSMNDPTTLEQLTFADCAFLDSTIDLTGYTSLLSFVFFDYTFGSLMTTVDLSDQGDLVQLQMYAPSVTTFIWPTLFTSINNIYLEDIQWGSSSDIDDLVLSIDTSIVGGSLFISNSVPPFTYTPSVPAAAALATLTGNGWSIFI